MKFCQECGVKLEASEKFCHECGTPAPIVTDDTPPLIKKSNKRSHLLMSIKFQRSILLGLV